MERENSILPPGTARRPATGREAYRTWHRRAEKPPCRVNQLQRVSGEMRSCEDRAENPRAPRYLRNSATPRRMLGLVFKLILAGILTNRRAKFEIEQ
jgi:hypothetical protein